MKLISVNIPEGYLDALQKLVEEHKFPNRSEAIRVAIRDLVLTEYNLSKKIKIKTEENLDDVVSIERDDLELALTYLIDFRNNGYEIQSPLLSNIIGRLKERCEND